MIRVTVWYENVHDDMPELRAVYPKGLAEAIADCVRGDDVSVRVTTLQDAECGLSKEVLDSTDVMLYWGHSAHHLVTDEAALRLVDAVKSGMGFIPLHSAHMSKAFRFVTGAAGTLTWRDGDREIVWCVSPHHPIARGVPQHFELPVEEMYGEPFSIPTPEDVVFLSWFSGGEVMRSGVTYTRGAGRIFYFQPGHETNGAFHNENVARVLRNAVRWAAPEARVDIYDCPHRAERIVK